jgi:hypothetical protein
MLSSPQEDLPCRQVVVVYNKYQAVCTTAQNSYMMMHLAAHNTITATPSYAAATLPRRYQQAAAHHCRQHQEQHTLHSTMQQMLNSSLKKDPATRCKSCTVDNAIHPSHVQLLRAVEQLPFQALAADTTTPG